MAAQFCASKLDELTQLVQLQRSFMSSFSAVNLVFSLVAVVGNFVIIHALWKASSIPANVKKLLLSLAFSDLAVGMLPQLMLAVIIVVMLKMASAGDYHFASFCPTVLDVCYFFLFLLFCATFLNITAIAVDRLFAVLFHLRYQALVTSKRIIIGLVSLWLMSGVVASMSILLPEGNSMIAVVIQLIGLILTTVAYIHIYKVVRYHQNQIQSQIQLQNDHTMEFLQQKKFAYNALFVYVNFLACYLPLFTSVILLLTDNSRKSFLVASEASVFLVFLNSSLNPLIYCWRYREIRNIAKSTVMKIFHVNENGT